MSNLRDRLACERGLALPVAIMMLMIFGSLAIVFATQAATSDSQSRLDRGVKRAVAAADAGVDASAYRLNKMQPMPQQCAVPSSSGQLGYETAGSDGWCAVVSEQIDDNATYTYQASSGHTVISNGQRLLQRKVVSTGNVSGVKRRVLATFAANTLIGNFAILTESSLDIGNYVKISGDVGSNGNVILRNNATLCGKATYGPGKQFQKKNPEASQAPPECLQDYSSQNAEASPAFVLSPVSPPALPTDGNTQLTTEGVSGWNSSTRELRINSGTVTLTGDVYSFCYLGISNTGQLVIPTRPTASPVRIYLDRPENCPSLDKSHSPVKQVDLGNQAKITNLNTDPTSLIIFGVGSSAYLTSFSLDNGFADEIPMVIYAPLSLVELKNSVVLRGGIVAKTVSISNTAQVKFDPVVEVLSVDGVILLYRRQSWVECKRDKTSSAPDSGC